MKKFNFWVKWLKTSGVIIILSALFIALGAHTKVFNLFHESINPSFFGDNGFTNEMRDYLNWVYPVAGSMFLVWGLFIFYVTKYAFAKKEKWAWRILCFTLIAWFVIDQTVSLYHQVYFNFFGNFVFALMLGLPLLMTRNEFKN